MADIFGGVQPPAWLQAIAKPIDTQLTGHVLGTGLAGLGLWAKDQMSDKPDDQKISVGQGVAEARLSQNNPMWKLQSEHTQAVVMGELARTNEAKLSFESAKREQSDWLNDANKVVPWLLAGRQKRATMDTPDGVTSSRAISLIDHTTQLDDRMSSQEEIARIRGENSASAARIVLENQKRRIDWDNAVGAAPPEVQAQIAELPDQGWLVDSNKKLVSPSTSALGVLNGWRTANRLLPYGQKANETAKPNALDIEKLRQSGRLSLEDQRAKDRLSLEGQVSKDRTTLEDQKAKDRLNYQQNAIAGREDIESMKEQSAQKIQDMRDKSTQEVARARTKASTLTAMIKLKQSELDRIGKSPILAMDPSQMGKSMTAERKRLEDRVVKLSADLESMQGNLDTLNDSISAPAKEPGEDYRPGSMNPVPAAAADPVVPAAELPKVSTPEQQKQVLDWANQALRAAGNNTNAVQEIYSRLRKMGIQFTTTTNANASH